MQERIINDTPPPADVITTEPTFEVVDLITGEILLRKPAADVNGLTIVQAISTSIRDENSGVGARLRFTEDDTLHEFPIMGAQRLVYRDGGRVLNVYQWT